MSLDLLLNKLLDITPFNPKEGQEYSFITISEKDSPYTPLDVVEDVSKISILNRDLIDIGCYKAIRSTYKFTKGQWVDKHREEV